MLFLKWQPITGYHCTFQASSHIFYYWCAYNSLSERVVILSNGNGGEAAMEEMLIRQPNPFMKLTFGFNFQRLAAGLSPIIVGEWSTNGPWRESRAWAGFDHVT